MELRDIDKQIILYSKGWFKKGDKIEDLKIMTGKWSGIDPKYYNDYDMYHYVVTPFVKCMTPHKLELFFKDIYKYKNSITMIDMIYEILGELSVLSVDEIPDLGKPDYNLLPSYEKISYIVKADTNQAEIDSGILYNFKEVKEVFEDWIKDEEVFHPHIIKITKTAFGAKEETFVNINDERLI